MVLNTTRTTVSISIFGSTLSFLYYMLANEYVPIPIFNNVKNQTLNSTLNYSNPSFGIEYVRTKPGNVTFTIDQLTPGKNYDLYFFILNLNQIYNPTYFKLSFQTLGNHYYHLSINNIF